MVLRDLHPADDLAGRLHRAAHGRLLAGAAGQAAPGAAQPVEAARARDVHDQACPRTTCSTRAAAALKKRRYRVVVGDDAVSAEKGYLREAGNLVFHLSVLVVLVGFAIGGLLGYKGGVIVVEDSGFSNDLTQYDDFVPGSLFKGDDLEPFSFTVKDFEVDWLTEGPRAGMAQQVRQHPRLPGDARLGGQDLRPPRQPPADHRQHRGLPDRPRLRAGRHHPRRQRRRDLQRTDALPAHRQDLPVLRRGQGAVRQARADRAGGRVLPDASRSATGCRARASAT